MNSGHLNRILCAGQPRGSTEAIERVLAVVEDEDAQAIALIGDLGNGGDGYRKVLRQLGGAVRPVYWIPGPGDAPADRYLRESYNTEVAFPLVHGVHGTAAFAPNDNVVFAGMGGEINDDPDAPRDEQERLHYPRWEAEYRLKVLNLLDYNELVMMFTTPPAHKGRQVSGSEALAELVGTYRPRLVVCGGEPSVEILGKSLVVAPGDLAEGHYAMADLHARTAEPGELSTAAK